MSEEPKTQDSQLENFSERIAIEPFKQIDPSQPIKILPIGKFYRGDRVLDITPARAQEAVSNFKNGLPRYGVKINVEHNGDATQVGKTGKITDVFMKPDGVYAMVEHTDVGKKLLEEDRFDGVSPEIVWTLNSGAKYQDPQTGKWHDNVLVGLALTNSPFFGNQVAVFSDKPQAKSQKPKAEDSNLLEQFKSLLKQIFPERFGDGPGMHDVHMDKAMQAKEDDMTDEEKKKLKAKEAADEAAKGKDEEENSESDDEKKKEEEAGLEKASAKAKLSGGKSMTPVQVTAEEFAEVKAKAEKFAEMQAKLEQAEAESKKLAEQFAAEQMIRRTNEFRADAEKFNSLPTETPKLGDHLLWLNDADTSKDKEHFAYFNGLLTTVNKAMGQSELFKAFGTGRTDNSAAHPFLAAVEKTRLEVFKDKPYAEGFSAAFKKASADDPALAAQYVADKQGGRL